MHSAYVHTCLSRPPQQFEDDVYETAETLQKVVNSTDM